MKNIFIFLPFFCSTPISAETNHKNRVIALTDIGADPDDTQSLVKQELPKYGKLNFIAD